MNLTSNFLDISARGNRRIPKQLTKLLFLAVGVSFLASCSADRSVSFATGTPDVDVIETFLSPEGNNPFLDQEDIEDFIRQNPGNPGSEEAPAEGVSDLVELSYQFDATDFGERIDTFVPNSDEIELRIPMVENSTAGISSQMQVQRPSLNQGFVQNPDSSEVVDSYVQDDGEKVLDLLVVIDNSGSMREEQSNLSTKLSSLLTSISGTDWRMQFTTTDANDDCLVSPDFLSPSDSDLNQKFADAVRQGTRGSAHELGVQKAVRGLQGCAGYPQWRRPNSNVSVLLVSDEDNCSKDGIHCAGEDWDNAGYLTDYLSTIGVPGVTAKVHGLFHIPGQECSTAFNVGTQYNDLIDATNGTKGTICSDDYTSTLNAISQDLSDNLMKAFSLSQTPVPGTLVVSIDGQLQTSGFTVNGNSVEFASAPPVGANISFTYDVSFTAGPITSVSLDTEADPSTISVFVDGVASPSSNWFLNDQASIVHFTSVPAAGQQVLVQYLGPKNLLMQEFELDHGNVRDLVVKVDQVQAAASTYSVDTSGVKDKIVFNSGSIPQDGATVDIDYRHSHEIVLSYSANLSNVDMSSLGVSNDSGSIPYSLTSSGIAIDSSDFMLGSDLVVTGVSLPGTTTQLSAEPLAGSVFAVQGANVCTEANGLSVSGAQIDFSGCTTADPMAAWGVSYEYVVEHRLAYSLQSELAEHTGKAKAWIVSVDGVATLAYDLAQDDSFSFSTLPLNATIDISVFVFPDAG